MSNAEHLARIAAAHEAHYANSPEVLAWAPGRVNLLGEHTDYNGGYVLPMALRDLGVSIAADRLGTPGILELRSETFNESAARQIGEDSRGHWSDFLLGCAASVAVDQVKAEGLRLTLDTTLPLGAGLSSSAALEVATLRALCDLYNLRMTPVEIAIAARAVENDFIGVPCGIMDQFASSVGTPGQALFLNTRSLDYAAAPGLPGHGFVVLDSGVSHQLTDGGYATRVAECQAACEALQVGLLSDLSVADTLRIEGLPAPLNRRARHIVTDNRLACLGVAALERGDAEAFGRLMVESHSSERNDYEITVKETDALAEAAVIAGALGARQTGGGWGGAVVALVAKDRIGNWCATMTKQFRSSRILAVS